MTKIILIRHGESEANEKNLFAGFSNFPLTERGHKQAELTAEYIVKNYKVDKIYSSDLKRAYFTALPLAKKTENIIIPDERLREIYAGEWESAYYYGIPNTHPEAFKLWSTDIGNSVCPGGESVNDLSERIWKRINEIAKENDGMTVAVATHATPIRAIQTLCEYGNVAKMQRTSCVPNASVTELIYEKEKFTLKKIGYADHLKDLFTTIPKKV